MIRLATFNLCNFGVDLKSDRLDRLGAIIVKELQSPELLGLQEVSASHAAESLEPVSAAPVYRALAARVRAAGGPDYEFREVAPLAGQDGGQTGFNIRVGLLFDPQRIEFTDRGIAGPNTLVAIRCEEGRPALSLSPGRIDPEHPAFKGDPGRHWRPSRKALTAELRIGKQTLFVIVCHFKSMRAALRRDEDYAKKQRHAQAEAVHRFVAEILSCDPNAAVVVLGDMNDVPGSKTLRLLKGELLENLVERVAKKDRYTRRHGFRAQALDHILVSRRLSRGARVRIPHVNADFPQERQASDHDPVVAEVEL